MSAKKSEGGDPVEREVVITRMFDAPRELVWKAWTEQEMMAQWWGPRGFTNPVCKLDVRPGGSWHIVMKAPDGAEYPCGGVYREIIAHQRLAFTNDAVDKEGKILLEGFTTVTFAEENGKTKLTLRTRGKAVVDYAAAYLKGMEVGWTQSVDRLESLVAAASTADRAMVISRVLDAPRELAWEAMTNPRHLVKWWGPRGFTTTIQEMDVKPGGRWKQTMHGPDGANYPNLSVFKEVVRPERLVFEHEGKKEGSSAVNFVSTWTFDEVDDGKTKVTIRMVFASAAERDRVAREFRAIEGGQQTLARFAEELAKWPLIVERTFDAPMATVWRAISDFAEMKKWYFQPYLQSFEPVVGFQTQFNVQKDGKDYLHIWKVMSVTPGTKIAYSWKYGGFPGESLVTFELFPDGNKTRLKLTHEGLETFLPEKNPQLARGNFNQGWTHIIGSALPEFLHGGKPG
ncbi:MAG: SRPBCC domain-containing protein [Tepidisphaeraceae bacterium]|jgi:uncharacterized protein YndB with AHSA1/START domain